MEFGILSTIDEGMKEALTYKTKIMSIQKVLDIYVVKELANCSKASKRFSFNAKNKFSELPNNSHLGQAIRLYTEIEVQRIQYKSRMLNEVKGNVLNDYSEFLNKFPPLNKIRQKLANMLTQAKTARNKAKPADNVPVDMHSSDNTAHGFTNMDPDVLLNEFMNEAKTFKKLLSDLIVDEKNILTLIAKTLHYELEYHKSCASLIDSTVSNIRHKLNVNKTVFGVCLQIHLERENCEISHVINDCICYIINYELDESGLFRLAPSDLKIRKLVAIFDTGMTITKEYFNMSSVVSTCLKRYLLKLPVPLIPFDLYNDFKQLILSSKNVPVGEMKKLVDKIPQPFYRNLHYLMKFLSLVASHSKTNKMDEMNLGIVFGPAILRKNLELDNSHDLSFCDKDVATYLIRYCGQLFPQPITLNSTNYYRFSLTTNTTSVINPEQQTVDLGSSNTQPLSEINTMTENMGSLDLASDSVGATTKPPYHIINQKAYNDLNDNENDDS